MSNLSLNRINWPNSIYLITSFTVALIGVPLYLWNYGLDAFQVCLFIFFYYATGMSITLGYHRLFSHKSFKASWPVKLFTLLFGAAAFESSLLIWASDHRNHHKHVDHDEDPYNIKKGFFHAHVGWLLYDVPHMPLDNVKDLKTDNLVRWQHNHYLKIAF
jgi:stearoyl-CoA desaturase (delta-9 desaturase)